MTSYIEKINTCLYDHFDKFTLDSTYQTLKINLVFHTWVAMRGAGIPDGTAQEYVSGTTKERLNYVAKIKEQAAALESQMIPVMIVYSRRGLPADEESKTVDYFKQEKNVVLLCLEDITAAIPPVSYKHLFATPSCPEDCSSEKVDMTNYLFNMTFHLPLAVINHADQVLCALRNKAVEEGKREYVARLNTNGGNAIMYADMDIMLRNDKVPPEVIAKNGMCSWPQLNRLFTLAAILDSQDDVPHGLRNGIREHANVFDGSPEDISAYMFSGRAFETVNRVLKTLGKRWDPCVGSGTSSMMLVAYSAIQTFKRLVPIHSLVVNLHRNPAFNQDIKPENMYTLNDDPLFKENHTLIYLQLLPYMDHRHDSSWHRAE